MSNPLPPGSESSVAPEPAPSGVRRGLSWLSRYPLLILLAVALLRGVLYTLVVPPWQHPDEPAHFEHVRIVAETGQLPAEEYVSLPVRREIAQSMLRHNFWRGIPQPDLDDQSLSQPRVSPLGVYTFSQPRLYYAVAGMWLAPWLGLTVEAQLAMVRLLSVVLSLVVVACAYGTARLAFPNRLELAIGAAALVVFLPGFVDIMAASNNDALINALSAALFLSLAWLFCRPWTWRRGLAGLGFSLLLIVALPFTKTSALALLAVLPFAIFFYLVGRSTRPWLWVLIAVVALLGLAGAAWLTLQYALTPEGKPLADFISRYFRIYFVGTLNSLLGGGRISYAILVDVVFKSFWALFGWRHVYLADWAYALPLFGMIGAIVGLAVVLVQALRRSRKPPAGRLAYLAFAAVAVVIAAAITVLRGQVDQGALYHSHGRYAYVVLVPFAVLFTAGWLAWLPAPKRRWGLAVYLVGLVLFDALAFWGFLVPYYYS